ncbi:MAG TPA: type II toxin-antitoxin system VapC family toxin [Thermoanaerobaculia bacterium]|jgi:tRNA(fMet)-specific endonuclease VapC|nr:type II toxin-antitoxin system VapC family toxin [Thermoanaerobaculia bacterium]
MTLQYMLDTDTVSYALRGHEGVVTKILEHPPSELCVSAITVSELRYGAARRNSKRLHNLIDSFTGGVAVVAFDEFCAHHYGDIAADLEKRGAPIGQLDVMIAAHAMALDIALVTNNVKHFQRIRGLKLENWA